MYTPAAFRQDDLDEVRALVASHPLGDLVSTGADGVLATAVPMLVEQRDGRDRLVGHIARRNPQRHHDGAPALVSFRGPDAYVTPSWYPSKAAHGRVVPTWDYVVVRARGTLIVRDDATWVRRLVERLTERHEAPRPSPWSVADAPDDFVQAALRAIVGVEVVVESWEGAWKLSQNRPAPDIDGVVAGLREGDARTSEVADFVDRHRPGGDRPGA